MSVRAGLNLRGGSHPVRGAVSHSRRHHRAVETRRVVALVWRRGIRAVGVDGVAVGCAMAYHLRVVVRSTMSVWKKAVQARRMVRQAADRAARRTSLRVLTSEIRMLQQSLSDDRGVARRVEAEFRARKAKQRD